LATKLSLSLAVGDYDHMRDLTTGRVTPDSIEIHPINAATEDVFSVYKISRI
jgi:4,5-dihydroxyphthalate decarboxylase